MSKYTKIVFVMLMLVTTIAFAKTDLYTTVNTPMKNNKITVMDNGLKDVDVTLTPHALPNGWKLPIRDHASDVAGPWWTYTRWDSMFHMFSGLAQYYGLEFRNYDFPINSPITFDSIEAYWFFTGTETDSTIRFQIYGEDGITLLWESADILLIPTASGSAYLLYDIDPDITLDVGDKFYLIIRSRTPGFPMPVGESNSGATVRPRRRNMVSGTPGSWGVASVSPALTVKMTGTTDLYAFDVHEGFEDAAFPPTGWTSSILTGTIDWERHTNGRAGGYKFLNTYLMGDNTGTTPDPAPGMATYRSYDAGVGDEARLNTPAIVTSGTDYQRLNVRFYLFKSSSFSADNDTLFIETSTNAGLNWTTAGYVTRYSANVGWTGYVVDCGIYAPSSSVNVGFRAKGVYGDNLYIDQVMAWQEDVVANDVGVIAITIPPPRPIWVGDTREITVRLKNYGLLEQTSFDVTYDPGDGSGEVTEPWTGSLLSGNEVNYTFLDEWNCNTLGELFTFKAYTEHALDENLTNDTATTYVAVCPLSHTPPFSKDFNEPWGPLGDNPPYCGWTIVDFGDEPIPTWNPNDWFKWTNSGHTCAFVQFSPLENQNEWLITPILNCGALGQYTLGYWHNFVSYACFDTAEVKFSLDNGLSWTTIAGYYGNGSTIGTIDSGYKSIDVTSVVAGESNVKFAFNYRAYDAYYWAVDDFSLIPTYTLTATIAPPGGGTVALTPPGGIYASGTVVSMQANAAEGYQFVNWTGSVEGTANPIDVTMNEDKNVTANFALIPRTLTVLIDPVGTGTVVLAPPGGTYPHGTIVTMTANANPGYAFIGWTGDASGLTNPYFITMNGDKNVTATFTLGGWFPSVNVPQAPDIKAGKFVKDGGAMVTVGNDIYAFPGNKSNRFYKYTSGAWVTNLETIPYGKKPTDPLKINKKKIGKGASLCYDGTNIIYATKGNSTKELWAYDIPTDTWTAKAFVPVPKALKGGTSIAYHSAGTGTVYLLAGGQKVTDPTNFYAYNVLTDEWTPLPKATEFEGKPYKDGSCITNNGGYIYALQGGGKHNYFAMFDVAWFPLETIPLAYPTTMIARPKKNKVKDGGAMTNDNAGTIYAIKGGGKQDFWKYTFPPSVWTALDTIPRLGKKSVPKTGAALAYTNGKVWLMKGNNLQEFWYYVPGSTPPLANTTPETYASVMTEKTITTSIFSINVTPNPFTKHTIIRYTVPVAGKVSMKLYNASGRLIETLVNDNLNAGSYTLEIRNSTLEIPRGVYFLKYEANNNKSEVKLIVQ